MLHNLGNDEQSSVEVYPPPPTSAIVPLRALCFCDWMKRKLFKDSESSLSSARKGKENYISITNATNTVSADASMLNNNFWQHSNVVNNLNMMIHQRGQRPKPIAGTPPPMNYQAFQSDRCDFKVIQQTCSLFGLDLVSVIVFTNCYEGKWSLANRVEH